MTTYQPFPTSPHGTSSRLLAEGRYSSAGAPDVVVVDSGAVVDVTAGGVVVVACRVVVVAGSAPAVHPARRPEKIARATAGNRCLAISR